MAMWTLDEGTGPIGANLSGNATIYIKVLRNGYTDAVWETLACLPVTLPDKTGHAIPE